MDKIDRLLDALEHPDLYSENDIEELLTDPEVREVYYLLDKTKATLAPISTPDIDTEWDAFRKTHPSGHRRAFRMMNLFNRNIAASITVTIASLAAVAAVVGISVNYVIGKKPDAPAAEPVAVAKEIVVTNGETAVAVEAPAAAPETITFDNEPLETIATRIAGYYGYQVEFSSEAPKSLRLYFRWNRAQTLDEVVESLNNFEQIHIAVKDKTIKID